MGKREPTAVEEASQNYGSDLPGETTIAAGAAGPWCELRGPFNIFLGGAFTGTVTLECSFDGGATAFTCRDRDGTAISFTVGGQYRASHAGEQGLLYRLNRGAGTEVMTWRMSR